VTSKRVVDCDFDVSAQATWSHAELRGERRIQTRLDRGTLFGLLRKRRYRDVDARHLVVMHGAQADVGRVGGDISASGRVALATGKLLAYLRIGKERRLPL
jgi:hypothetical protein